MLQALFGFKDSANRSVKGRNLLLLVAMFGSTFRSLLLAGLCLSDSQNFAEDQVVVEPKGSPVLRRFNFSSPTQLQKTLDKAQVRIPRARYLRYTHDKHNPRTVASMSGRLPPNTSISTSHPTRLHHPSSYRSKTFRCSTLGPLRQQIHPIRRVGTCPSQLLPFTRRIIHFRRSNVSFRTWPKSIRTWWSLSVSAVPPNNEK